MSCSDHDGDNNPLRWVSNKTFLLAESVVNTAESRLQSEEPEVSSCEKNDVSEGYLNENCTSETSCSEYLGKAIPAKTLSCWSWIQREEGSGHLESPTGDSFYSYDCTPYALTCGIEYKTEKGWDIFWDSFSDFMLYAEENAEKQFKIKMLQSIPQNSFVPQSPEWLDEESGLISWYVPVLFSADDTFKGICVNTEENNDWINLYALYNVKTKEVSLMLVYNGDAICWDAPVEMNEYTSEMVNQKIKAEAAKFIESDTPVKALNEAVELCPYCNEESSYANWDVERFGYVAKCNHCSKEIFLCDECFHADDNLFQKCDWRSECGQGSCFRGTKKE